MPRKRKTYIDAKIAEYKKLAKKADDRLRSLESLAKQKGYSEVKTFAYKKGIRFAEHMFGEGATRFTRNPPRNMRKIESMMSDIKTFLAYKTSTRPGIKEIYKQVAATTNQDYGTKLTVDKLEDLYNSAKWEWLEKQYGSDKAIVVVGEIEKNKDYIENAIKNHEQVDFQLEDRAVEQAIGAAIKKYGLDVVDLY